MRGRLVRTALFALLLLPALPALAQRYGLADLQALVARREFLEAVSHLRDVAPTARNAAWDELAVQAVLGAADAAPARDRDQAFDFLREQSVAFPSVGRDPRVAKKLVDLGVEAVRARRFHSLERLEDAVDAILAADPQAIVRLVLEARYADPKDRLIAWVARNPDAARGDEKLKAIVLERTRVEAFGETAETKRLKVEALARTGWGGDADRASTQQVATWAGELVKGSFFNESNGRALVKRLGSRLDDATRSLFYAPLALMSPSGMSEDALPLLEAGTTASRRSAEDALLQSTPESPFWFSGMPPPPARWQRLQRALPRVVQQAERECAAHRRNPRQAPAHVAETACEWLGR